MIGYLCLYHSWLVSHGILLTCIVVAGKMVSSERKLPVGLVNAQPHNVNVSLISVYNIETNRTVMCVMNQSFDFVLSKR